MQLYPNPVAGSHIHLLFGEACQGSASVVITDAFGKQMNDAQPIARATTVEIPVAHLPSGVYRVVVIFDSGQAVSRSFVKILE